MFATPQNGQKKKKGLTGFLCVDGVALAEFCVGADWTAGFLGLKRTFSARLRRASVSSQTLLTLGGVSALESDPAPSRRVHGEETVKKIHRLF